MRDHKILIKVSICLGLLVLFSCFDAPVEITINTKIKIGETSYKSQIKKLRKEVIKQINSSQKICVDAFSRWLESQFSKSRIPKRLISALEYGSHDPTCPSFDLESEIPKAWQRLIQQDKIKLDNPVFDLEETRKKLEKTRCLKKIISPKSNNLTITNIKTEISKNTLNFDVPVYKIYYATRDLKPEEIKKAHAEKDLLAQGAIKLLGATRTFGKGFVGIQDFDFIQNPKEKRAAMKVLQTLSANLIAFPQGMSIEPQLSYLDNQAYYVIPEGEAELVFKLDILINLGLGDIGCLLKISDSM